MLRRDARVVLARWLVATLIVGFERIRGDYALRGLDGCDLCFVRVLCA